MADRPGDVQLNGKWYKIDFPSYKVKDIIDFAPRAATPGGSVVMSDLNLYQPLMMTDWKHGMGFSWHTDPMGYLRTDGHIDTRHSGRVMLNAEEFITDSAAGGRRLGFATFSGYAYSYGDGGLRRTNDNYDGATWETPTFSGVEQMNTTRASGSGVDELTWEHTVTALGQNRLLVVRIGIRATPTVSSVTYGGVALTSLSSVGAGPKAYIYYLKAPTPGTADLVITFSSAGSVEAAATTYLYIDQTTPFGTAATATGTGTASSVAVTSAVGKIAIDIVSKQGGVADALIIGASQIKDFIVDVGGANTSQGAGSYEPGAATNTMTWSWTNSRAWAAIGVSLNPATQAAGGNINFALATEDYMFYCPDGQRIRKISAAEVDSAAGLNASSIDYKWLIIHKGFIYAGKDNSHRVHYSDQEDLNDLEGTTSDPDAIYVGIGNKPTKGAIVYAGNLYVSRRDGLWHIGDDNIARNVIDLTKEESTLNFESMTIYNGLLIFPVRDRIYQWNGSRVADITPQPLSDEFPYVHFKRYLSFMQGGGYLYCLGETNHAAYPQYQLLSWDGASWHKMFNPTDGVTATPVATAMFFDATRTFNTLSDTILYGYTDGSTHRVYAWYPARDGEFPYPAFPVTGTHALITSRLDMGFRRVVKSATSLLMEVSNVTSTRYLAVYYKLDDAGDWLHWADIKRNGVVEIRDPGGKHTVEFHYIKFRINFITDNEAQTPVLESFTLRFIMRPDVRYGYNFNILAAPNLEHGRYSNPTLPSKVVKEIRTLRDSKATIEFTDIVGDHYYAYISSMTEIPLERKGDNEEGGFSIEYRINVNLVVL